MSKTPSQTFFFPGTESIPSMSIEAESQDEAIKLYEQELKKLKGDKPS